MSILTVIDHGSRSDEVLRRGHELAAAFEVDLVVVKVLSEGDEREGAEESVRAALESAVEDPDRATVSVRQGPEPVHEILDEAERVDAEYIVLGTRKRTPIGKAVLGSDSQLVLLNAEIPVVSVPYPDD